MGRNRSLGASAVCIPPPTVGDRSNLQFLRREAELTQALLPTDGRSRTLLRGEIRRSLVCVQKNYNPPHVGVMEDDR